MKFLTTLIIVWLLNLNAMDDPLITGFPSHFSDIPLTRLNIAGVTGFRVDMFPEPEKNRNHWDSRASGSAIQYLVLHCTDGDVQSTLSAFTEDKPTDNASAHYVITRREEGIPAGLFIQVVPEEQRAWHAGVSFWKRTEGLNHSSIGIEHVNKECRKEGEEIVEWFPFDDEQIIASGRLCSDIVRKYHIRPDNVVGHSDIAPIRKPEDPGVLFPWKRLYEEFGVGAWLADDELSEEVITAKYSPKEPLPHGISAPFLLGYLSQYGYSISGPDLTPENQEVIRAFKSHFSKNQCIECYNFDVDKEDMLWVWGLVAKYQRYRDV